MNNLIRDIKEAICLFYNLGDWSNGMIGVSKTFGGGSIPSSPVSVIVENLEESRLSAIFNFCHFKK